MLCEWKVCVYLHPLREIRQRKLAKFIEYFASKDLLKKLQIYFVSFKIKLVSLPSVKSAEVHKKNSVKNKFKKTLKKFCN